VFLPKRFTAVFSDVDREMINIGMITIALIYHGTSEKTGAIQLSLKQAEEQSVVYGLGKYNYLCRLITFSLLFSTSKIKCIRHL
jgi:hypothetical protein